MIRWSHIVVLGFVLWVATPSLCVAQTVVVPGGQDTLIVEAADAANAGDLDRAERTYRAALQLGELNIIYVGLARVLQRQGDCHAASQLFVLAAQAPAAAAPYPSPEEIVPLIENFRADMEQLCPGKVIIHCSSQGVRLVVDDVQRECEVEFALPPGEHAITAELGDATTVQTLTVTGLAHHEATVELLAPEPIPEPTPVQGEPEAVSAVVQPVVDDDGASSAEVTGWTLLALGGVSLAGGGTFSWLQASNNDDIARHAREGLSDGHAASEAVRLRERSDRLALGQWIGFGVGGAAVAVGVGLLFVERPTAQLAGWRLTPWLARDGGAGVTFAVPLPEERSP